jgi:hypothetical protein
VIDEVPVEYLMFFLIAPPSGSLICDLDKSGKVKGEERLLYPEINVQVAASANLIRHGHLEQWVSLVQRTCKR